jgi:hypothetical protein
MNFLKGFGGRGGGLEKYNLIRELDECKIGQSPITMKTTNKKVKECTNKCRIKIVKLMCL